MVDDVTLNTDQGLYVIPASGGGYSCLGFDVLVERYNRLGAAMKYDPFPEAERGTLAGYALYMGLMEDARATGQRFTCELSPQLVGLEGHRVEVRDQAGDPLRRFIVGTSTGWIPIHLEVARRTSSGGGGARRTYATVRDLGRVR